MEEVRDPGWVVLAERKPFAPLGKVEEPQTSLTAPPPLASSGGVVEVVGRDWSNSNRKSPAVVLGRPSLQISLPLLLAVVHGTVVSVGTVLEEATVEESHCLVVKGLTAPVELFAKEEGEAVRRGDQMRCCLCFAG